MHCSSCNITKLSEEFPDETLTEDCEHAALHCLRVSHYQRKHNNTDGSAGVLDRAITQPLIGPIQLPYTKNSLFVNSVLNFIIKH